MLTRTHVTRVCEFRHGVCLSARHQGYEVCAATLDAHHRGCSVRWVDDPRAGREEMKLVPGNAPPGPMRARRWQARPPQRQRRFKVMGTTKRVVMKAPRD